MDAALHRAGRLARSLAHIEVLAMVLVAQWERVVKRVGVLSSGKVLGCLYGLLGLLIGGLITLMSLAGFAFAAGGQQGPPLLFGILSVVLLPIFYGVVGFIGGIISAALYNLVAALVGGIEIELSEKPPPLEHWYEQA